MKIAYILSFLVLILLTACDSGLPFQSNNLSDNKDSVSYCLGINIATKLKKEGINEIDYEAFKLAIEQVLDNDTNIIIDSKEATEILQNYFIKAKKEKNAKNLNDAQSFLNKNKSEDGVKVSESGMQYKVLNQGNGASPQIDDIVTINYKGAFLSGEEFDNTFNGNPVTFPVKSATNAWQEALTNMKTGSRWKLFVHPNLAYGEAGAGDKIEPNMLLIYEIELLSIDTPTK